MNAYTDFSRCLAVINGATSRNIRPLSKPNPSTGSGSVTPALEPIIPPWLKPALTVEHGLAPRQMRGFGGMISLDLNSDLASARRFLKAVQILAWGRGCGRPHAHLGQALERI